MINMVISMRVFFIFDIKEEFKRLYQDSPRNLYRILKQIYYLDKEEVIYGTNIFYQIVRKIPKQRIDNYLFVKLHQDIPYSKRENVHYYNNLHRNEVSRLTVRRSYMKIMAETDISSFFSVLADYKSNYFVCDFEYQDYFFLSEVKTSCLNT